MVSSLSGLDPPVSVARFTYIFSEPKFSETLSGLDGL